MAYDVEEERSLLETLLIPSNLLCEKCNTRARSEANRGSYVIKCTWRCCRASRSFWKGSVFEKFKLKPEAVLGIVKLWHNCYKTKQISQLLGIRAKTVKSILVKAHKKIVDGYYSTPGKIGGNGIIVEVDESKFSRRKYNRGHRVEGVWVLGIVERTSLRRAVFIVVNNRNLTTLEEILKTYVEQESIVYTDCWRGYNNIGRYFVEHHTVNHSLSFVDRVTGVHTNTIEGTWNGIKMGVSHRYRTSKRISAYFIKLIKFLFYLLSLHYVFQKKELKFFTLVKYPF